MVDIVAFDFTKMAKIALVATVTEAKSIRQLTPFAQEPDRRIDRHCW